MVAGCSAKKEFPNIRSQRWHTLGCWQSPHIEQKRILKQSLDNMSRDPGGSQSCLLSPRKVQRLSINTESDGASWHPGFFSFWGCPEKVTFLCVTFLIFKMGMSLFPKIVGRITQNRMVCTEQAASRCLRAWAPGHTAVAEPSSASGWSYNLEQIETSMPRCPCMEIQIITVTNSYGWWED